MPESEMLYYMYNSDNTGTKTVIPRVGIAPGGEEAPTPSTGRWFAGVRKASGTQGRRVPTPQIIKYILRRSPSGRR